MAKKIKKVKSKLKPETSSSDDESSCHDTSEYKFVYYPDLKQKYKQYANKTGELLLKGLNKQMAKILKRITEQMEEQKLDVKKQLTRGITYIMKNQVRELVTTRALLGVMKNMSIWDFNICT